MATSNIITSANTVLLLGVTGLLDVPQQIQGFATDDIFSSETVHPVETMMGVDGLLSGGYVPTEKPTVITLMAGSASNDFFDAWQAGQDANLTAYTAFGYLSYPSIGKAFVLTTGFLTDYVPIADSKKLLQPRKFGIKWQSIVGSPISAAG